MNEDFGINPEVSRTSLLNYSSNLEDAQNDEDF